jgi:transposase
MANFLSLEQKQDLLLELKSEKGRKHADRIRIILLLDDGKKYKDIQEFYFIDEGTVRNWRKRYIEGGLERLMNDYWKVKRCILTPNQLEKLDNHLMENTYRRTKDIVGHIKKEFGIEYKENSVLRILNSLGYSYKKAKKVPSKASIEKQKSFLRTYAQIKNHGPVYFLDSAHPKFCPVTGYGWIKKGEDKYLLTNAGKVHLNITGAVDPRTCDVITRQSDWIDENAICELLKAISSKNQDQKHVYVVMDNARYNKSEKVRKLAKKLNLTLKYIPPYSPNLNLAERLWRFLREEVLSLKNYESLDIFSKTCSQFFRGIRKHKKELETLLADNFQLMGT